MTCLQGDDLLFPFKQVLEEQYLIDANEQFQSCFRHRYLQTEAPLETFSTNPFLYRDHISLALNILLRTLRCPCTTLSSYHIQSYCRKEIIRFCMLRGMHS
jgi:hypothetical protein